MRIVREGTPLMLVNVRPFELPDDVRHSGFRYTKFVGDFTGKDFRFIDIADSDCRDIVLPSKIADMQSKRTRWRGATIPASLGSHNGDLQVEAVRGNLPNLTGTAERFARITLSYVAGRGDFIDNADERKSWADTLDHIRQETGWTKRQIVDRGIAVFDGYPRMQRRLRAMGEHDFSAGRNEGRDPKAIPVLGTDEVVDVSSVLSGQWYRWQAARDIEALLGPNYRAHVDVLRPLDVKIVDVTRTNSPLAANWFRQGEEPR